MSMLEVLQGLACVALAAGIYFLARRHWRKQTISCAEEWTSQQGLSVKDWSKAVVQDLKTNPCISFVASTQDAPLVDVKLRLARTALFGRWKVGEVAYCLPRGIAEDDTRPMSF